MLSASGINVAQFNHCVRGPCVVVFDFMFAIGKLPYGKRASVRLDDHKINWLAKIFEPEVYVNIVSRDAQYIMAQLLKALSEKRTVVGYVHSVLICGTREGKKGLRCELACLTVCRQKQRPHLLSSG